MTYVFVDGACEHLFNYSERIAKKTLLGQLIAQGRVVTEGLAWSTIPLGLSREVSLNLTFQQFSHSILIAHGQAIKDFSGDGVEGGQYVRIEMTS